MNQSLSALLSAAGLFVGMILLLEVGRRLGRRRQSKDEERARAGLGAFAQASRIEGAATGGASRPARLVAGRRAGAAVGVAARQVGRPVLLPDAEMEVVLEKFRTYGQPR